ncbi:hypothetical protein [Paraburkholderia fungorum]|uniref:Uncharacterized protein n=1 Tax=Paraburkholderia fungorum TaxID=134537 RepID=A0AAW3V3N2_9BURK|nr:hypothetical protein [Paraburkholderia fungorum]MBB4515853.1 hypothetical protein [Paraburkholderia fungorum]MBB6203731.1 hypothetical protein [Paraburkholderia fungorum]
MNFVPLTKPCRRCGGRPGSPVHPRQPATRKQEQMNPRAGIYTEQRTGSARDTWFSPTTPRKSLIIEKITSTSHRSFATSCRRFAMSLFSGHRRAPYSSLLSKLLKEKKKEGSEKKESDDIESPRVGPDLPSIEGGACFLGHASHRSTKGDSWQLMAPVPFEISHLVIGQAPPTYPCVALRVVRCGAPLRAG